MFVIFFYKDTQARNLSLGILESKVKNTADSGEIPTFDVGNPCTRIVHFPKEVHNEPTDRTFPRAAVQPMVV